MSRIITPVITRIMNTTGGLAFEGSYVTYSWHWTWSDEINIPTLLIIITYILEHQILACKGMMVMMLIMKLVGEMIQALKKCLKQRQEVEV